jgi:large subunit ribosomal protein L1
MDRSKRYKEIVEKLKVSGPCGIDQAVELLKLSACAKFDETVELAVRLGVDPKRTDMLIRGTVVLPHGTGRKVRILVLAKGEKVKEAEDAGADFVGSDEFIAKIQEGWLEFDTIVATPDMMKDVGRLGKILGPRGLMPNPKSGTVTFDLARAVTEARAGKIEYRTDKTGNVHAVFGKGSFTAEQLKGNLHELVREIVRAKPAAAKGQYIKSATISTTMGPGIRLDVTALVDSVKQ